MRERHKEAERINAQAILDACKIVRGQDFHTLSATQVERLLAEADLMRYRKPENANGSRARYFYALLQRRVRR